MIDGNNILFGLGTFAREQQRNKIIKLDIGSKKNKVINLHCMR